MQLMNMWEKEMQKSLRSWQQAVMRMVEQCWDVCQLHLLQLLSGVRQVVK